MLDFIFIIGASGIGKSTLARNLLAHFKTVVIEQNMVPEFVSRDGSEEMTGELEELTCWENTKAMALCFHRLAYKNIIVSDLDDLRTQDIPSDFKGYRYITLKLVCSDAEQLRRQMENRTGGLVDFELQQKCSEKTLLRPLLPNELLLDIVGMTESEVATSAVSLAQNAEPLTEYEYEKPPKEQFYSWVFSNGLR